MCKDLNAAAAAAFVCKTLHAARHSSVELRRSETLSPSSTHRGMQASKQQQQVTLDKRNQFRGPFFRTAGGLLRGRPLSSKSPPLKRARPLQENAPNGLSLLTLVPLRHSSSPPKRGFQISLYIACQLACVGNCCRVRRGGELQIRGRFVLQPPAKGTTRAFRALTHQRCERRRDEERFFQQQLCCRLRRRSRLCVCCHC